jgi:hypothetical protein
MAKRVGGRESEQDAAQWSVMQTIKEGMKYEKKSFFPTYAGSYIP